MPEMLIVGMLMNDPDGNLSGLVDQTARRFVQNNGLSAKTCFVEVVDIRRIKRNN